MEAEQDPAASGREAIVAGSLMRMALALLDRAGESTAAARLQHALDTLDRRPPGPLAAADLYRFDRWFEQNSG